MVESINTLNKDQKIAFDVMTSGENIFLTGEAGTGKSYVTNVFIEWCKANKKNVAVSAPTGVAALNVGGVTMHRLFHLPIGIIQPIDNPKKSEVIKEADVVIIDEISMARFDMFTRAAQVLQASNSKAQLICVGDFFQLPPVLTDDDFEAMVKLNMLDEDMLKSGGVYAFNSPEWQSLKMRTIALKEQCRQSNAKMIKALNQIRVGKKEGLKFFNKASSLSNDVITLTTTNKLMREINEAELRKIPSKVYHYDAAITGTVTAQDKTVEDRLLLKEGAKIRFAVNDQESRFINGTEGKIVTLDTNKIIVEAGGLEFELEQYEWNIERYVVNRDKKTRKKTLEKEVIGTFKQYPIKLGYAMTIHKSQGQSYDAVNLNLGRGCFAAGQLYVALSRAKNIEGLRLSNLIKESDLITSEHVKKFMNQRGGKRKGAGAKNSKWTKGTELRTMKVPADLYDEIMKIAIELHHKQKLKAKNKNKVLETSQTELELKARRDEALEANDRALVLEIGDKKEQKPVKQEKKKSQSQPEDEKPNFKYKKGDKVKHSCFDASVPVWLRFGFEKHVSTGKILERRWGGSGSAEYQMSVIDDDSRDTRTVSEESIVLASDVPKINTPAWVYRLDSVGRNSCGIYVRYFPELETLKQLCISLGDDSVKEKQLDVTHYYNHHGMDSWLTIKAKLPRKDSKHYRFYYEIALKKAPLEEVHKLLDGWKTFEMQKLN